MSIFEQTMNAVLDSKLYPGKGVIHSVVKPGWEWVVRVNGVYWKARSALASYSFQAGDAIRPIEHKTVPPRSHFCASAHYPIDSLITYPVR